MVSSVVLGLLEWADAADTINAMLAPDACDKLTLPIFIVQGGRD